MFTSGPEQWLRAKSSLKNGCRSTWDKGTTDIFIRTRHLVRLEHRFQLLNGLPLFESALPTEIYKVWETQPCGQDGGSRETTPNIIYVYTPGAKRGNKELPGTLLLPAVRELFVVALLSQRALSPIRRLKALSK